MANYLVLLAGGRGRRFGGDKLSVPLVGIPLKEWTRFYVDKRLWDGVVWVGSEPPQWLAPCVAAAAGDTRHRSWLSGARAVETTWGISPHDKLVFHDVARPFATYGLFERVIAMLDRCDVVFPALRPSDALRRKLPNGDWKTVRREDIYRVQTPQGFRGWVVKRILDLENDKDVYDEVDLALDMGASVCEVDGEIFNSKITYPEDLISAEQFIHMFVSSGVGLGADFHLLRGASQGGVPVGGIVVPVRYEPIAWSDGDALLHSLMDAILSASGIQADIGTLFPPGDPDIRNASSVVLLRKLLNMVNVHTIQISSVVFAEFKLADYRQQIVDNISQITGAKQVAITFKSLEGFRYDIYGAITIVKVMGGVGVGDKDI